MEIKDIEKQLWEAANQLRGNMSSEEYMHIILGILSLKYISDKYDSVLEKEKNKDIFSIYTPDQFFSLYDAFKVPKEASWKTIMNFSSSPEIGQIMDKAFMALEKENPMLEGIFDKNYNRESIDQMRLGEVVKIFSNKNFTNAGEDIIGRIYEYFLGKFFKDRGQKGGEFYTPKSIVKLIVNLIKPLNGTIYDPACGTGGMFIQAKKYILEHGGNINNVTIYGQEFNNVTWKLAKLNLILNGFPLIDNDDKGCLGDISADTFSKDQHKHEKFDYIMANPPFNMKNWGREKLESDPRWQTFGLPPKGNANYAWLLHMVSKLSSEGKMATVLANGSLSSSGKEELTIRKNLVKANIVDAIIALPDKLFYTTGIPACIWVFNNNKKTNDILMIDGSEIKGNMISKKLRELEKEDIKKIVDAYNNHLGGQKIEIVGFAKSINSKELSVSDYSFVPGRYVGFVEEEIDKEAIKGELKSASKELFELMDEFEELLPKIKNSIKKGIESNKK